MERTRTLLAPDTGKVWTTRCSGASVTIAQGAPGVEKTKHRDFDDASAAFAWAQKEEWSRLKKGMVLVAPDIPAGQPRLHRFVGGAYTGAMALADFGGRLLCNRNEEAGEQLVSVNAEAEIVPALDLHRDRLVWKAVAIPELDRVLLLVDHQVVAWTPSTGAMVELTPNAGTGFLSAAGTRAAWFDGSAVVVHDLATGTELMRHAAEPQLYSGHSPQMEGALSPDGRTLAFCVQAGEVRLFDTATGSERAIWRGGFEMVKELCFAAGGSRLLALGLYGRNSLHGFDLESGQTPSGWPDFGDLARADIAVAPSGSRVAVARGSEATIYEAASMKAVLRFPIEHVVRRCVVSWIGNETLAVRTDYGCASLYTVN